MKHALLEALSLTLLAGFACSPPRPALAPGIDLDERDRAARGAVETAESEPGPATASASQLTPSPERGGDPFVELRTVASDRPSAGELPIHINDGWWAFRARRLGTSQLALQQRDARIGAARAPAGFWDPQTAVEAVSVWTTLCNQCHGGRRHLDDVDEMPEPPADWGKGTGLFFGNRRAYRQLFGVVHDGGPLKEDGRVGMPAWRTILSNEMIWAMLYFLEYQSGGIESRFPPSLYPRPSELHAIPERR